MELLYKQCKGAFLFKTEETYNNIKAQWTCSFQITFECLSDHILKPFLKMYTLKMTGLKVPGGGIASMQRSPFEPRVCITANALLARILTVAGLKRKRPGSVSTPVWSKSPVHSGEKSPVETKGEEDSSSSERELPVHCSENLVASLPPSNFLTVLTENLLSKETKASFCG